MAAPAAASRLPWCSFFLLFIASLFFSSIALSQSAEDTATDETPLTEKQIEQVMTRLVKAFENNLGAKIR
jgi:hypothetical protein